MGLRGDKMILAVSYIQNILNQKKRRESEIEGDRSEIEDQVSGRHLTKETAKRTGRLVAGAAL